MNEERLSPDPRYGPWKFLHEIELEDMLAHPIWLWCMALGLADEDDGPMGGDETSMRPFLVANNVTADMWQPLILLRVKGAGYFATGLYDHKARKLESINIETQTRDEPTALTKVGGLRVPAGWNAPVTFVAAPNIDGQAGVEFLCESFDQDEAQRVG